MSAWVPPRFSIGDINISMLERWGCGGFSENAVVTTDDFVWVSVAPH